MKRLHLVIKEEARNEIFDAFYWYESKLKGLGNRFVEILDISFGRISSAPFSFSKKHKEMRQAIVVHFPFVIIFEIEDNQIIIYAVFNTKRNPKQWRTR